MNINYPSDHRLIRATIKLANQKKSRIKFTNNLTYQLNNEKEISKYKDNLTLMLQESKTRHENNTVQTQYDHITNAFTHSLKLARETKDKQYHKNHKILSTRTASLLERRRELQKTKNKTRAMRNELSALYKLVNKYIKRDYTNYRLETIERHTSYRQHKKGL